MPKLNHLLLISTLALSLWLAIAGFSVTAQSIAQKQAAAELHIIQSHGYDIVLATDSQACQQLSELKGYFAKYCLLSNDGFVLLDKKQISAATLAEAKTRFALLVLPFIETAQPDQAKHAAVRHALMTLQSMPASKLQISTPLPPIAPPEVPESRDKRPSEHRELGFLIFLSVLACALFATDSQRFMSYLQATLSRFHGALCQRPKHTLLLALALVATIIPFWIPLLPPATDLPQHLGQMYLLEETLAGHRPDLLITPWYYPNTLVYVFLYSFWKLADPITAGRLILSFLAAAWVGTTYLLCRQRQRPFENWLIAVPLVFNFLFTWGLLNFLMGWPVFCVFIVIASQAPSKARTIGLAIAALALYYAHALWFAMANVWVALLVIDSPKVNRQSLSIALSLVPAWILALAWYPQLAVARKSSGVDTSMIWSVMPLQRLEPEYLQNSMLGSIHADIEGTFCLVVFAWLIAIFITRRKEIIAASDKSLIAAGSLMLLGFWVLPNIYMNTIFFGQRWLPFAFSLLMLGLPQPRIPRIYLQTLGLGLLVALATVTSKTYKEWEEEQLDGFLETIALVQNGELVLGLNLSDGSSFIKGRPGLQLFSYVQPLRGAEPQFSFTEHYSGIVQFRSPPPPNPYQVWSPFIAKRHHPRHFDKILVNGSETLHTYAKSRWHISQIGTGNSSWRIYRNSPDNGE